MKERKKERKMEHVKMGQNNLKLDWGPHYGLRVASSCVQYNVHSCKYKAPPPKEKVNRDHWEGQNGKFKKSMGLPHVVVKKLLSLPSPSAAPISLSVSIIKSETLNFRCEIITILFFLFFGLIFFCYILAGHFFVWSVVLEGNNDGAEQRRLAADGAQRRRQQRWRWQGGRVAPEQLRWEKGEDWRWYEEDSSGSHGDDVCGLL